jgi:hypothetical protein
MKDGHLNKCKDCAKKDSNATREKIYTDPVLLEKYRSQKRKYLKGEVSKTPKPKKERNYNEKISFGLMYPEKKKASSAVQKIKDFPGFEKHHWSYLEQHRKDIIIISKEEHYKAHIHMIYDQERMQYRKLNGELLYSKDAHLEYLRLIGILI